MEIPIIIDDREHDLISTFSKLQLPFSVKHLEIGDMCLGKAVIERKKPGDFVASLCDGRLTAQCFQMQEHFENCCLVIEGQFDFTLTNVPFQSILGMLASLCARTNIKVVMLNNSIDLAYFTYQYLIKSNDEKEFNYSVVKKQRLTTTGVEILMLIEGISVDRATLLLTKFGNINRVLLASMEQLQEIDGIGAVLSTRIKQFAQLFYH